MLFVTNRALFLLLCICNGLSQSAIWVGGVNIIAHWYREQEWGKSVGIANFFSGLSHITANILPAAVGFVLPFAGWKLQVIIPICLLIVFVLLFAVVAKGSREEAGAEPYQLEDPIRVANEKFLGLNKWNYLTLVRYLFSRKYFGWWCMIAFLSSICRYGLLEWVPIYFGEAGNSIMTSRFEQILLPLGMAFGTMVITWYTGFRFLHNKGIMVVAMAALCASSVIVFPMVGSEQSILTGIFITGFVLYGINGILWVHAIDQGGRICAGTVAGILNGFAYLGATVQGFLFSSVIRIFDSYIYVCIATEVLCIMMVLCAVLICKNEIQIEDRKTERDSKFA